MVLVTLRVAGKMDTEQETWRDRRVCEQRMDLAWRWAAEGKNDDDSSIGQTVVDHMFPGVLLKCRLRFRGPGEGSESLLF